MKNNTYQNSLKFAQQCDREDPLAHFRDSFFIPEKNGKPQLYFCGNSLGLQPKTVKKYIQQELDDWKNLGVQGHTDAQNPWMPYHESLAKPMAKIVGASPEEVIMMNTLSVNLHLMMVSFYQPTKKKYKIIIESDAFPSDKYAVASQLKFHGIDPNEGLILWQPRKGEELCRYEDLEQLMETYGNSTALLLIGSTNYYTGQSFPLKKITALGHHYNVKVGIDLAHGAGNIQPNLHENGPDFAVWCSYKYLNSGPGSVGGCFVHDRHAKNTKLDRFAGWWGHNKQTRFNMRQEFDPIPGAEGWQLSNPPILSLAAIKASLAVFEEANFERIREKSLALTGLLEFLLNQLPGNPIEIITPSNPQERGCQLSLKIKNTDKQFFEKLTAKGVVGDWREPNVIRLAPVPLYNTFEEVYQVVEILKRLLAK